MDTDPYPEHTKLKALNGKNEVVGNFLVWLTTQKGYQPCRYEVIDTRPNGERKYAWVPALDTIQSLITEHFVIDQKALAEEKTRMWEEENARTTRS